MSTKPEKSGYGCFRLGDMNLAVPMSHLKEVVPLTNLHALPCQARYVTGGIHLRGLSLPVIDLRLMLDRTPSDTPACVIVVQQGDRLLGLAADKLLGLQFLDTSKVHTMSINGELGQILWGCMMLESEQLMLSVLEVDALLDLNNMPSVLARHLEDSVDTADFADDGSTDPAMAATQDASLMLFRCGKLHFGITPTGIEGTMANPQIETSGLTGGFFRGLVEHRGLKIPAVSLASLAGFTDHHDATYKQALIVRTAEGPAAYLVDEILEIISTQTTDYVPVTSSSFAKDRVFTHALPNHCIPEATRKKFGLSKGQHLIIDAQALAEIAEVFSLVKTYLSSQNTKLQEEEKARETGTRLLTYILDREYGTPLEQVVEVLPYSPEYELYEDGAELMGLVTNRGRSIPLFNLAARLGCHEECAVMGSCILVVETADGLAGFLVKRLVTIDNAHWEPSVPLLGQTGTKLSEPALQTQDTAELQEDGKSRMITILDLQDCARHLSQVA